MNQNVIEIGPNVKNITKTRNHNLKIPTKIQRIQNCHFIDLRYWTASVT